MLSGSQVVFSNFDVFLCLNVVLILANSADPEEMQHYALRVTGRIFLILMFFCP